MRALPAALHIEETGGISLSSAYHNPSPSDDAIPHVTIIWRWPLGADMGLWAQPLCGIVTSINADIVDELLSMKGHDRE